MCKNFPYLWLHMIKQSPESFDDVSNNDHVDSSNGHDGRSKHRGWRNKVKGIFHHLWIYFKFLASVLILVQYIDLFGGKVYEEREKEDHEAVEEESKQGWAASLFFGTCLQILDILIPKEYQIFNITEIWKYWIFNIPKNIKEYLKIPSGGCFGWAGWCSSLRVTGTSLWWILLAERMCS